MHSKGEGKDMNKKYETLGPQKFERPTKALFVF